MSTPSIRQVVSIFVSGGSVATVNTGAGTAVDDLLVCFAGNDWNAATAFNTPSGTAGTWGLQATGDNGANNAHQKLWTRKVTVGGAQTVTVPTTGDAEEISNTTFVLTGQDLTTPVDGAAGGNGTTAVAPSVSPATSDALLLCGVQANGVSGQGTFTPPSGMTEQSDITDGTFSSASTASLVLSASGATGTKAFTPTAATTGWASASIAIKGAGVTPTAKAGPETQGQVGFPLNHIVGVSTNATSSSWSLTTAPAGATTGALNSGDALSYVPPVTGSYTFTYSVTGPGGSASDTVVVDVVASANAPDSPQYIYDIVPFRRV